MTSIALAEARQRARAARLNLTVCKAAAKRAQSAGDFTRANYFNTAAARHQRELNESEHLIAQLESTPIL